MVKQVFYFSVLMLFLISCGGNNNILGSDSTDLNNNDNTFDGNTSRDWLIPVSEVKDGGPGKDGIPSIDTPKFIDANDANANFLKDEDLVIGIVKNGEIRAYPHKILDWHEIVNDNFNDDFITINYCPLTGTAFGWNSFADGAKSTFGVSGLLYNTNLILYDRSTSSYWSQLKLKCVNGILIGDEPLLENVVETNWKTWKALYPNTKVLSIDTGFSRDYNNYPYGDYKTNNDFFLFTASPSNDALPNKERVYAILDNDISKVYQFQKFSGGKVIKEVFNGKEYLVVGNENLIYSFELNLSQSNLNYQYDFNNSEIFFKDNEGNKWSIFGEALEGPRVGEKLKISKSVVSFWFAIAAFYPNPEIYTE
ncbi:hypothetical protein Lupro_11305 [Lutibacter profundi]|uniref:DUF3179 domain-containing protein n=1 Tax=Lutibacter profundi TaxID=1622118 RepID=A0A120IEI8_9FLAO|nr:DUF3179 domain-containing protein [Lutibacter profundi]AMC11817.1 hypothetical protein Lupro_11305 [Lutibacter profundi]